MEITEKIKNQARKAVAKEIRRNKSFKPLPCICSKCKEWGLINAHHPDYLKPLDIVWLCKKCHMKIHWVSNKNFRPSERSLEIYWHKELESMADWIQKIKLIKLPENSI